MQQLVEWFWQLSLSFAYFNSLAQLINRLKSYWIELNCNWLHKLKLFPTIQNSIIFQFEKYQLINKNSNNWKFEQMQSFVHLKLNGSIQLN